jgi:hypothetical protein
MTLEEDFQRFNSILDVTTERMKLVHRPTDVLDDRFLTNLRQYLLEAGATSTDLKIIAVRIVTVVAPRLLDRAVAEPEITAEQTDEVEAVLKHLLRGGDSVH